MTRGYASDVEAHVIYPVGRLHCDSITWGAAFTVKRELVPCSEDAGQLDLLAAMTPAVFTGVFVVATVHFRAGTVGTGQVSFGNRSGVVDSSMTTNILTQTTGGTYTISPK